MKIIALGDTHGRNYWEEIVSKNVDADKFVFIGDYFDSKEGISAESQILNFERIIEFKKSNHNKVVLLFGNHDFHYTENVPTKNKYSGYQYQHSHLISKLIQNSLQDNLLQMCYRYENILFSHAGISKRWCKIFLKIEKVENNIDILINDLFKTNPKAFEFYMGGNFDFNGDDICQTPIWIRPPSLNIDKLDGFKQVVGHTVQNQIDTNNDIIYIDTFEKCNEYLLIEKLHFSVETFF